ncbi:unnamed protein product [Didymodactylos carnosus]|uniref:Uncharacterized protein n=1 Tax=Didymodactylos carnosus TaxID=1234261 RepID=A0A8S2VS63_9BILA|nr:unnamed protein product [Didymodactylos carnosus]
MAYAEEREKVHEHEAQELQQFTFCENNNSSVEPDEKQKKKPTENLFEHALLNCEKIEVQCFPFLTTDYQGQLESVEEEDSDEGRFVNGITKDLIQNKEEITLIWFDNTIDLNDKAIRRSTQIYREINDYILFYTEQTKCINYIESIKNEKIFFVVFVLCAKDLISKIHSLKQIHSIFVYCTENKQNYEYLLTDYTKVLGIFKDQQALVKSIKSNLRLVQKQSSIFNLYDQQQKSFRNLTKESSSFLWFQLFKEIVQKMSRTENAKKEMLEKCRAYYYGNKKELTNIDGFELTYVSNEAIFWYTKDGFVHKLINKALRTEDIDALGVIC